MGSAGVQQLLSHTTDSQLDWGTGIWLGHYKTFKCFPLNHLCYFSSMLRVIVLLEGEPPSQSQISGRLKQVSLRNFPVFSTIIPSILTSFPVTAWCCHHHASLWGWSSQCDERCWVCTRHSIFLDGQKAQFLFHLTRVPSSMSLGSLPHAFWWTPNMFAYFFLDTLSDHSEPSSVECTA